MTGITLEAAENDRNAKLRRCRVRVKCWKVPGLSGWTVTPDGRPKRDPGPVYWQYLPRDQLGKIETVLL